MTYNAYNARTGSEIVGTLDWIPGKALINDDTWFLDDNGNLSFEYYGETKMFWDGCEVETYQGRTVYVDENGIIYAIDRLAGGLYILELSA